MSLIVCFDIDGTLTTWPEVIVPLAKALKAAGWKVVMLTGNMSTIVDDHLRRHLKRKRELQVAHYGIEYDEIQVCVGKTYQEVAALKGKYVADNKVTLFIDNDVLYCKQAKQQSPSTLTLECPPKKL